jgi:chromate reductase, NAD(P)H dehydrogenase (quinone)
MSVRVLTLCGSLQQASSNRAALDVATATWRASGVDVDDFQHLAAIPPFNPEADPGQVVADLRSRIASADVVLIAAPEYAGGLAGVIKNALDWIVGSGELYLKPIGVISSGSTGGHHSRQQLIQTLTWHGAHVVVQLGISYPKTKSSPDGQITDPTTLAEIELLAKTLAQAPTMLPTERLATVRAVVDSFGIDPGHIAGII